MQILSQPPQPDCCGIAFLSGIFHSIGEIKTENGEIKAYFKTDIQKLYDYLNEILNQLYGDFLDLEIEDDFKINKTTYYKISLPSQITRQVLQDTGFLNEDGTINESEEIDKHIVQTDCCKKSFITGAFIGSATSSIRLSETPNKKTTSGYHIEFISHSRKFLKQLSGLLEEYEIYPKITLRRKVYSMYIKESAQVCDLLALVGAHNSVLKLQNELALRELRNNINRQTNCMNANISKTVDASMKQLEAIETINSTIGIEALPDDLQEVVLLRLANTEETLDELLKLSTIKLTKSGLNHRFRKIIKLAESICEADAVKN